MTDPNTAGILNWEDAGTEEPGDQNANSVYEPRGFWSLGPDGDQWSVVLIVRDDDLNELPGEGISLGRTGTLYTMLPEQLRTGDHLIRGMCVREVDTILGTHVERDEHGAPTTFVDLLVSDNDKVYRWQLDTSAIVMVLR